MIHPLIQASLSAASPRPEMFEAFVDAEPKPQPRARQQRITTRTQGVILRTYTPPTADAWRRMVLLRCRQAKGFPRVPWTGPIGVFLRVYFPRPQRLLKPGVPDGPLLIAAPHPCTKGGDADNIWKSTIDALTPPPAHTRHGRRLAALATPPTPPTPDSPDSTDHLAGYAWLDDNQVHIEAVWRYYVARDHPPGAYIRVRRITDQLAEPTI